MNRRIGIAVAILLVLFAIPFVESSIVVEYPDIQEIPPNESVKLTSDYDPVDSGYLEFDGGVIWNGEEDFSYQLFLYNGTSVIQLTDDPYYEPMDATIRNGKVVWAMRVEGRTGHEIFYYNGVNTIQITDDDVDDRGPQIHNDLLVWQRWDDDLFQMNITLTDGSTTLDLGPGYSPRIHQGKVAWEYFDGNDYEIRLFDGHETIQLTDNNCWDRHPEIHDGKVAWVGYCGPEDTTEIFLYDGEVHQVTDNNYNDYSPQIEDILVWGGYADNENTEIFLLDQDGITQVTDNEVSDHRPKIHNGILVWESDYEIVCYDHNTPIPDPYSPIIQVTNDQVSSSNPDVFNGIIVYYHDHSIYAYRLDISQLTTSQDPGLGLIEIGLIAAGIIGVVVIVVVIWNRKH